MENHHHEDSKFVNEKATQGCKIKESLICALINFVSSIILTQIAQ